MKSTHVNPEEAGKEYLTIWEQKGRRYSFGNIQAYIDRY